MVRSPVQRRVRRSEVEALAAGARHGSPATRAQRRSLWLHRAVAGKVAVDPDRALRLARRNLATMRQAHSDQAPALWLDRWAHLLDEGPEAVMEALTSGSELAVGLRQNSPFAGLLSEGERAAVHAAFRDHERRSTS